MNLIHSQAVSCLKVMLPCILLGGCLSIDLDLQFEENPELHAQIITQKEDLFADVDPLFINDEVKQLIDANISFRATTEERVEILQDLLYGEDFLNVQYSDEKTHTALEAFYAQSGNCLGVINLYIAMARYTGVEACFQTVDVQPSWDRRGDLLVLSQHINATGRITVRRRYIVDFTPEIALQQLTFSIITDEQARAYYFNNLGVEELIAGNTEQALVYFKNSLFLDNSSSMAWNNIGTAFNRLSNKELAEYSYRKAFSNDQTKATAINNLAKFYRSSGDTRLAREYELAISRFNQQNPYYHFAQGNLALAAQNLEAARVAFRCALRLKKAEPDFYFALAQVYAALGNAGEAQSLVESANELLATNAEIYKPSSQKVRIIDAATILREASPGLSIIAPGGRPSGSRN